MKPPANVLAKLDAGLPLTGKQPETDAEVPAASHGAVTPSRK